MVSFFVSLMVLSWIGKLRRTQAEREAQGREKERQRRMDEMGASGPDDLMARAWVTGNRPLAISLGTARLHAYVAASDGNFTQEEFQRILAQLRQWNAHPMVLQFVGWDLMWFTHHMNIEAVCKVLREGVGSQAEILTIFQSAVDLAAFDGAVDASERRALNQIADLLGLPTDLVEESIRLASGTRYYRQYARNAGSGRPRSRMNEVPHRRTLQDPGPDPQRLGRRGQEGLPRTGPKVPPRHGLRHERRVQEDGRRKVQIYTVGVRSSEEAQGVG